MPEEIIFSKYEERGPCHIKETKRSIKKFNANQQARFDLILEYLGDIKGKRILDLGCGDGALTYLLCKKGAEVVGVDNSELGLKYAKDFLSSKGFQPKLILGSAYDIPLSGDLFDYIVASEIIEHLQEPERLLAEARRLLKNEGKIIISTPYRLTEKPSDKFHAREYYPLELSSLVGKYFQDIRIEETHNAFWYNLYSHEFSWPYFRKPLRYLINFLALYLDKNPFKKSNTVRKKWDFYTQIFLIACKK